MDSFHMIYVHLCPIAAKAFRKFEPIMSQLLVRVHLHILILSSLRMNIESAGSITNSGEATAESAKKNALRVLCG